MHMFCFDNISCFLSSEHAFWQHTGFPTVNCTCVDLAGRVTETLPSSSIDFLLLVRRPVTGGLQDIPLWGLQVALAAKGSPLTARAAETHSAATLVGSVLMSGVYVSGTGFLRTRGEFTVSVSKMEKCTGGGELARLSMPRRLAKELPSNMTFGPNMSRTRLDLTSTMHKHVRAVNIPRLAHLFACVLVWFCVDSARQTQLHWQMVCCGHGS